MYAHTQSGNGIRWKSEEDSRGNDKDRRVAVGMSTGTEVRRILSARHHLHVCGHNQRQLMNLRLTYSMTVLFEFRHPILQCIFLESRALCREL